ncbi:hypothetical protein S245_029723 [Arachis hypogaea]
MRKVPPSRSFSHFLFTSQTTEFFFPPPTKTTLASTTAAVLHTAAVRRFQELRLFVVLQPLSSFPCSSSVLLAAQSRFARRTLVVLVAWSPSSVVLFRSKFD